MTTENHTPLFGDAPAPRWVGKIVSVTDKLRHQGCNSFEIIYAILDKQVATFERTLKFSQMTNNSAETLAAHYITVAVCLDRVVRKLHNIASIDALRLTNNFWSDQVAYMDRLGNRAVTSVRIISSGAVRKNRILLATNNLEREILASGKLVGLWGYAQPRTLFQIDGKDWYGGNYKRGANFLLEEGELADEDFLRAVGEQWDRINQLVVEKYSERIEVRHSETNLVTMEQVVRAARMRYRLDYCIKDLCRQIYQNILQQKMMKKSVILYDLSPRVSLYHGPAVMGLVPIPTILNQDKALLASVYAVKPSIEVRLGFKLTTDSA